MRLLDWIVLGATLLFFVVYGLVKGRGSRNIQGYFLADRSLKWYTVALSIMATQASAITFTSTPGQAYADGMRFVQFYFGLPIAMVILSITAVPIYHKLGVYTAYEYLEQRFDPKTRVLTSVIFLIQRGLGAGITIYAPSIILSVMLGIDLRITSLIIGGIVIVYTTRGGVKSVSYTDFYQLLIIMLGMIIAFLVVIHLLPPGVAFVDALRVAGGMGRLNVIDFTFDLNNRYNFWSGLFGGLFVALAYFGTDQSQVQRYLTGRSIAQSRLGLLFNGFAKVPMQFFILLLGAMVFVFYQFVQPPLFFNPVESASVKAGPYAEEYRILEGQHSAVFAEKSRLLEEYLRAKKGSDEENIHRVEAELNVLKQKEVGVRSQAIDIVKKNNDKADPSDTNYIFLSFVLGFLPAGLVGLIFACIFAASMSSSSGELSALATTSIIDVYKRFIYQNGDERHYLIVSRAMMAFWGIYAIAFAQYASRLGSLIEAVNILGSLFYGTMLGVFLLAFYVKSVGGTATFLAAFAGEGVVLWCFLFTKISWLWYNVVGCVTVVAVAWILSRFSPGVSTKQSV